MLQTIHDDLIPMSSNDSPDASYVSIPDTQFLLTAKFKRSGPDLVLTGEDDQSVVIANYFAREKALDLVGPDGATLTATVVCMLAGPAAPGQYAQATPPTPGPAIARVDKVSGVAQVTHANGVTEPLSPGAIIFAGDVIQTGRGSALAISFGDGTTLNFSANTRMVMNEFAYEANSTANSGVLTLVHGSFAFIAGQVAKTGGLNIETPVATMGIRGTTGGVAEVLVYPEVRYQFHAHLDVKADGTLDRPSAYDLKYRTAAGETSSVKVTYGSVAVLGAKGPGQPPELRIAPVDALVGADAQSARQYQQMVNSLVSDYPGVMQNLFPLQSPNQGPQKRGDLGDPGMREVTTYGGAPGSATSVAVIETTNFANAVQRSVAGFQPVVPTSIAVAASASSGVSPNEAANHAATNRTLDDAQSAAKDNGVINLQPASPALPVLAGALTDLAHEGTLTFARDLLTGASSGNQTPLHIANVTYSVGGGEASPNPPTGLYLNGTTLTFDPQDPTFDHLAGGEQKTIVVSYLVVDGHGTAVRQTETITIVGVDDAPMVSAGAPSAPLVEAGGVDNAQAGVNASVVALTKSDVDSIVHYDTTGWLANADGTFTKVGGYGSATLDPLHDTVTYHLDNALPGTQALTAGQHVTDDFTITVKENNGTLTATAPVAFAITGADDAAEIGGVATGAVTEDSSAQTGGALTVADVDAGEARFQTPAALSGDYGSFTFDATSGAWTYTLNQNLADPLTAGQIVHDALLVTSLDGTASQTIDVAITGANDGPEITAGEPTGAVTEAANDSSEEIGNITHQATGTLAFTDIDLADAHTVVVAPVDAGTVYRGSLSAFVADVSTGDGSGVISWTFEVTDSDLDDLTPEQPLTQAYTVTVSDGHGGTSSQIVNITLNGATDNSPPNAADDLNIAPSLVANSAFSQIPDFTGWTITPIPESNIYRAGNGPNGRDYSYDAYVNRSEGEDGTAVLSFSGWIMQASATEYGPSIRSDVFTAAGGDVVSFDWLLMSGGDYAVGQGFVRDASTDAIVETVFDYQTGFTGTTGWQHTEYTLSTSGQYYIEFRVGSYDFTGGRFIGAELQLDYAGVVPEIHEDKTLTLQTSQLLANDIDPDGGTLTITGVEEASTLGANVHLNGDGTITYDPRAALSFLAAGESVVDSFQYTVGDGHGGTDTATVSFTVHGRNDTPVVDLDSQDLTTTGLGYFGSVSADGSLSPIALHSSIADPDDNSLASLTVTLRNGHPGDFFNYSAEDLANLGISATVTGSADAIDDPLTITLNGQASRDSYAAALETISFGTNSTNLDDRHIDVATSDGLGTSATATSTIELVPTGFQFQALITSADTGAQEPPIFLSGHDGADTFVFGPDDNAPVTIAGFTPHTPENASQADVIDLSEFDLVSFEHDIAPLLHASENGADTLFDLPTGATVTLENVVVASLHASDFIVQSHH